MSFDKPERLVTWELRRSLWIWVSAQSLTECGAFHSEERPHGRLHLRIGPTSKYGETLRGAIILMRLARKKCVGPPISLQGRFRWVYWIVVVSVVLWISRMHILRASTRSRQLSFSVVSSYFSLWFTAVGLLCVFPSEVVLWLLYTLSGRRKTVWITRRTHTVTK